MAMVITRTLSDERGYARLDIFPLRLGVPCTLYDLPRVEALNYKEARSSVAAEPLSLAQERIRQLFTCPVADGSDPTPDPEAALAARGLDLVLTDNTAKSVPRNLGFGKDFRQLAMCRDLRSTSLDGNLCAALHFLEIELRLVSRVSASMNHPDRDRSEHALHATEDSSDQRCVEMDSVVAVNLDDLQPGCSLDEHPGLRML